MLINFLNFVFFVSDILLLLFVYNVA